MKISSTIKINGVTLKVKLVDYDSDKDYIGKVSPDSATIYIVKKGKKANGIYVDNQVREVAFLHELFHYSFHVIGRKDLYDDESLCDQLSFIWYQIINQLGERKNVKSIKKGSRRNAERTGNKYGKLDRGRKRNNKRVSKRGSNR